jgi:carboxyl-terminal processing protease
MKIFCKLTKKIKFLVVTLTIILCSFITASFIQDDFEISKNLDIFATLYKELNYNYVDETNPGKLIKIAIDGMLNSLDPYTNFISESEIEDYKFMTTGQYGGIGALIHKNGNVIVISDPYEGFPAQKNDIRAGDIILKVNDIDIKGKYVSDISNILKGQPGSTIKLIIKREGEKELIEKTIIREEIKIKNIPYYGMVADNIGYIQLNSFTENAGNEVKEAFMKLKGNNNLKSIIIDLRGNGGGLLNEAVNVCNIFVDNGKMIVSTKGKLKDRNLTYKTINNAIDGKIPLVILVDNGSASAAEIVAGAIQDLDRGVILGQRTYGKGLVQNVVPLSYNTKLKVTIAKYYIPSGRCIQAIDYSHRNTDGSVGKIPDSLITAFKTVNGRTVYDGGGIKPDITVNNPTYSNITISLITKYLIFNYATKYRQLHPSIKTPVEFIITDSIYNDFIAFLADKDYDYITQSEKDLENFKKSAEKEKYFDAIKTEYEVLKSKIIHNKKEDLFTFKNEISEFLSEEIVSRYYFQNGRIQVSLINDIQIIEAIKLLNKPDLYNSILKGTYKETDPE